MKKRYKLLIATVAAMALAIGGFSVVQKGSAGTPCGGRNLETVTITVTGPGSPVAGPQAPSSLVPASAAACQPPIDDAPDGVFLCYSKSQVIPGVWPQGQAAELLAAGYWYPNAVKGNVPGGPNLGDYHLVCNATGTPTHQVVNENGEVFPDTYPTGDSIGYYPLVS